MKTRTILISVIVLLSVLILAGCISFHPLGMSDSEWNALTPEQKIAAREKQLQLNAQKKQAEADRQAAEKNALARQYEKAVYGDIISVAITNGTMEIHGKRREYEPIAFDLIRGESKQVDIIRKGKKYQKDTAVVRLSKDGRTFYFDDKQSNRLVLVDDGWGRGKKYHIKEHKNRNTDPQNITINIRYRPVGGERESIIIIR